MVVIRCRPGPAEKVRNWKHWVEFVKISKSFSFDFIVLWIKLFISVCILKCGILEINTQYIVMFVP